MSEIVSIFKIYFYSLLSLSAGRTALDRNRYFFIIIPFWLFTTVATEVFRLRVVVIGGFEVSVAKETLMPA